MKTLLRRLVLPAWLLGFGLVAQANNVVTAPGPGGYFMSSGNNTLGYDFWVNNQPLVVTALGLWDAYGDGFHNSHSVGLWDASGTLLASVTLPAGTAAPLVDQFRWANLATPVTLQAGNQYVLGAGFGGLDGDEVVLNVNGNQATYDPGVTGRDVRFLPNSGFRFPAYDSGSGSEIGPNAMFTIPEPSSAWLVLTGMGCLLTLRRGRR